MLQQNDVTCRITWVNIDVKTKRRLSYVCKYWCQGNTVKLHVEISVARWAWSVLLKSLLEYP